MAQKRFIVEMDEVLATMLKNSGQIKIVEAEGVIHAVLIDNGGDQTEATAALTKDSIYDLMSEVASTLDWNDRGQAKVKLPTGEVLEYGVHDLEQEHDTS